MMWTGGLKASTLTQVEEMEKSQVDQFFLLLPSVNYCEMLFSMEPLQRKCCVLENNPHNIQSFLIETYSKEVANRVTP